jgi:hypothetical protein
MSMKGVPRIMVWFISFVTTKKFLGTCLMFDNAWSNAWVSGVWSSNSGSESDWLFILDKRCCNMVDSVSEDSMKRL